eukprot:gene12083-biopygen1879
MGGAVRGGAGRGFTGSPGISRGASQRANPRLVPRIRPPPGARPGRAEGADGTGGWPNFPTTVSGTPSVPSWRPFVSCRSKRPGNSGLRTAMRTAARARSGRANGTDGLWEYSFSTTVSGTHPVHFLASALDVVRETCPAWIFDPKREDSANGSVTLSGSWEEQNAVGTWNSRMPCLHALPPTFSIIS